MLSSRYPFTASQWQELEHQTLIYKYMASGIPIPSELIIPLRRGYFLDHSTISTTPTLALPPQYHPIGWGWGYGSHYGNSRGGKAEDPEPGRCRRTDGKKWRCSKEAYPDSKYCERHMHRGKNRSRKPVEMQLPLNNNSNSNNINININNRPKLDHFSSSLSISSSTLDPPNTSQFSTYNSSSSRLGTNSTYFHLDSNFYYPVAKDYRYNHGVKDVDTYSFFSDASSKTESESFLQFKPLGLGPLGGERKLNSFMTDNISEEKEKQQQQQHCFVLGTDFNKPGIPHTVKEESQKPLRRFFDDWPLESKDSWVDLESTQLSISIPMTNTYTNDD